MVNMYSSSTVPMGSNMNMGMSNTQSSVNVHQNLKAKFGVGYEDFGTSPYAQPYPMAIMPRRPYTDCEETWLARFIRKCFLS